MARKSKQQVTLTPSGHEFDQDLAKVPIKVSPSLQALIANQVELMDMIEGKVSRDQIFIEQHKIEMLQVEGEIAGAFSNHANKKEKAREKRQLRKTAVLEEDNAKKPLQDYMPAPEAEKEPPGIDLLDEPALPDIPFDLSAEIGSNASPPGLPSSRFEKPAAPQEKKTQPDVRRVALGASIKALQVFLGRELTEEEMQSLENQVDSYLG